MSTSKVDVESDFGGLVKRGKHCIGWCFASLFQVNVSLNDKMNHVVRKLKVGLEHTPDPSKNNDN